MASPWNQHGASCIGTLQMKWGGGVFVKKTWKMGAVFCIKKLDLPQRRVHYLFDILLTWGDGVRTHPTHPRLLTDLCSLLYNKSTTSGRPEGNRHQQVRDKAAVNRQQIE